MTGGRNGKGYGVLATPFEGVAFHDTPLHRTVNIHSVAFHDTPLHRTVNIHSWKEIALQEMAV